MKAFKVNRNQQDYYRVDLPPRLFLDGKRRSVMAKTRREAIEKAEALIAKRKKGLNTDRAKATVAEFLTRFLDYYQTEGGVALRTWQDYRYHIEANVVPAIGKLPLGDLKPLQVDEWLRPTAGLYSYCAFPPKYPGFTSEETIGSTVLRVANAACMFIQSLLFGLKKQFASATAHAARSPPNQR